MALSAEHAMGTVAANGMGQIVCISGSPSKTSKGELLLARVTELARAAGRTVSTIDVRELPPAELLAGYGFQSLTDAGALVARAAGVVVATPVYKAAYTGLLKCFLDTLATDTSLRGKAVFPIITAAAATHALALDYALKPVLASLGASRTHLGFAALDAQFDYDGKIATGLNAETAERFDALAREFIDDCDTAR